MSNNNGSLLVGLTMLAVGGLGLFIYKSANESEEDDVEHDDDDNMSSSSDEPDESSSEEEEEEEEEQKPPAKKTRAKTQRPKRATKGTKRRY